MQEKSPNRFLLDEIGDIDYALQARLLGVARPRRESGDADSCMEERTRLLPRSRERLPGCGRLEV